MGKRLFCINSVGERTLLWNPSYFIATVSENTEKQIREYIQNQKEK